MGMGHDVGVEGTAQHMRVCVFVRGSTFIGMFV